MVKLKNLDENEIKKAIMDFEKIRNQKHRYASYDFCYNYFREYNDGNQLNEIATDRNIIRSCHFLGYYLASWGMLRGSSKLLTEQNVLIYQDVVRSIAEEEYLWDLDVGDYLNNDSIDLILKYHEKLQGLIPEATEVLTTKIMMGVFGCVPAFDTRFSKSVVPMRLNERSLLYIGEFYKENQSIINRYSKRTKTYDVWGDNSFTTRCYTRAKIIDMIGFQINPD
jgi:hypothetical protein